MSPETMRARAAALLVALGVGEDCVISPLPGSRDQRTFKCRHRGQELVLKGYPPADSEPGAIDPFESEVAFYDYLESCQVGGVAQARGWDGEQRLGVFTFWQGRTPKPVELGSDFVRATGQFIATINLSRHKLPAALPALPVRERSVSALLASINQALLAGLPETLEVIEPLKAFWEEDLVPAWHEVMKGTLSGFDLANQDPAQTLPEAMTLITPGDLSVENTLIGPNKQYGFFDFEHAAWTDPACLIARFFCRMDTQDRAALLPDFMEALEGIPDLHPLAAIRSRLLLPAVHMEQALLELFDTQQWESLESVTREADATHRVGWMERLGASRKRVKRALLILGQA